MANPFDRADVADTSSDQPAPASHTALIPRIQAAVRLTLIHAYRDVLLLHFPVQYAAKYSARIEAVLVRMEDDEEGLNAEYTWMLLQHELERHSAILVAASMVLFL